MNILDEFVFEMKKNIITELRGHRFNFKGAPQQNFEKF